MRATQKYSAILSLAAGVVTSVAVAPLAFADDAMPTVGQSPEQAIQELESEGYIVAFNWTRGYPEVPLSQCTLVDIHNPDGSGPKTNTTVYLDVSCPPDDTD